MKVAMSEFHISRKGKPMLVVRFSYMGDVKRVLVLSYRHPDVLEWKRGPDSMASAYTPNQSNALMFARLYVKAVEKGGAA